MLNAAAKASISKSLSVPFPFVALRVGEYVGRPVGWYVGEYDGSVVGSETSMALLLVNGGGSIVGRKCYTKNDCTNDDQTSKIKLGCSAKFLGFFIVNVAVVVFVSGPGANLSRG